MIQVAPPPAIVAPLHKNSQQVSFKGDLKSLEAHQVWKNFTEISKIYRESGHCGEASEYIKKRMLKAGFEVKQIPNDGTIIATRGLNAKKDNAIILQSHMDIVGVSADGNPKKPIEFHEKDGYAYANDRTAGFDNGLGVAPMLTIADDPKFKKYPLQMIFTTDEETGMDGAKSISANDLYGKRLINLDSEKLGEVTTGCAGIARFDVDEPINTRSLRSPDYKKITVDLSGARGGHSADISPESLNPVKVLLAEVKNLKIAHLVSLSGGERFNSVPRSAKTEILVHKDKEKALTAVLNAHLAKLKTEKAAKNPEFNYQISSENAKKGTRFLDQETQDKVLGALDSVPVGLFTKFEDNGSSKTSQNFGVLDISKGHIKAKIMGRSADEKEGADVEAKTGAILSELFDKPIVAADKSPIWQPKQGSLLQDAAIKTYSDVVKNQKPFVKVEHGGLESAIFAQKDSKLEQISIGPTIEEPHSVQERVKIDTVVPFYNWLTKIIQNLPSK